NTIGMLHLKSGAPIVVVTTQRIRRRRFRFHHWATIEQPRSADRAADLHAIAVRLNDALSQAIRAYPEQWFWDSRRYRTRPEDEVRDARDLPPLVRPEQAPDLRNRSA